MIGCAHAMLLGWSDEWAGHVALMGGEEKVDTRVSVRQRDGKKPL
jgi:hypothetical protein